MDMQGEGQSGVSVLRVGESSSHRPTLNMAAAGSCDGPTRRASRAGSELSRGRSSKWGRRAGREEGFVLGRQAVSTALP